MLNVQLKTSGEFSIIDHFDQVWFCFVVLYTLLCDTYLSIPMIGFCSYLIPNIERVDSSQNKPTQSEFIFHLCKMKIGQFLDEPTHSIKRTINYYLQISIQYMGLGLTDWYTYIQVFYSICDRNFIFFSLLVIIRVIS